MRFGTVQKLSIAAESAGLPIFIEALYVETTETGFTMKTDSESLCKVVGVVGALGSVHPANGLKFR